MRKIEDMTHAQLVQNIHESINQLARLGLADVTDEQTVAICNDLRGLEPRLKTVRVNLEAEMTDEAVSEPDKDGRQVRTWMASNGYNYSFNNDRILYDTIAITDSAWEAFIALRDAGVIKFTNQITKVRALFEELDQPMIVVPHEIEDNGDLDVPHVGKYPKPKIRKYEIVKEDE